MTRVILSHLDTVLTLPHFLFRLEFFTISKRDTLLASRTPVRVTLLSLSTRSSGLLASTLINSAHTTLTV
jgi:hypothetical protein